MFEYKFSTFHFSSELPVDRLIYNTAIDFYSTISHPKTVAKYVYVFCQFLNFYGQQFNL